MPRASVEEYLNFSTIDIWTRRLFFVKSCSAHCRMLSGTSGLHPLDASSTPAVLTMRAGPQMFPDVPWKVQRLSVENHYFRVLSDLHNSQSGVSCWSFGFLAERICLTQFCLSTGQLAVAKGCTAKMWSCGELFRVRLVAPFGVFSRHLTKLGFGGPHLLC